MALSSFFVISVHCLIGLTVRYLLRRFLCVYFLRLTYLESDESDESDEEESDEFGSGSESGLFDIFGTGIVGLLSGIEFSRGFTLTADDKPAEPPPEVGVGWLVNCVP